MSIEVRPSARGVATIYDKEIVLYIASLMASKIAAGTSVAQDCVFTAHDLFSVTGANHSARSYARLSDALERLRARRSVPTLRLVVKAKMASSLGCPKHGCNMRAQGAVRGG